MKKLLIFLIITFSLNSSADYTVGLSAYNNGDTRTAIFEWLTDMKDGEYFSGGISAYYIGRDKEKEKNYIDAIKFYEFAAQRGIDFAQFSLGRTYYSYPEVRNLIYAYMWMEIGMSNGFDKTDGKNNAESHLSFEELALASRLSIRCALSKFADCTLKPEDEKRIADAKNAAERKIKADAKKQEDAKKQAEKTKQKKYFKPVNMTCFYESGNLIQEFTWSYDGNTHSVYFQGFSMNVNVMKLSEKDKFKLTMDTGQTFENDYNNYKSVSTFGGRRIFGICIPK